MDKELNLSTSMPAIIDGCNILIEVPDIKIMQYDM
jgi:hypothetical protein